MKKFLLALIILVGIAGIALIWPLAFSHTSHAQLVKIPARATFNQMEDTLGKYFGDSYASNTLRIMRLLISEKDLPKRHGAYNLEESTSPFEAARKLVRGGQTPIKFSITSVRNIDSFIPLIAAKFDFSEDSLRNVLSDQTFLRHYGLTQAQIPALFLNDTYEAFWDVSPKELMEKLGDNYTAFWNSTRISQASALGLSPADVVTIASIVDEETNAQSEKGRIGRLYINRLHRGMKLQSDPTIRFALQDFTIKRIKGEHLNAPGPYNTYRVKGLPPGPIRTTSKATIDAILKSDPSDDIYMCAKADFSGTHAFASTYPEHLANARAYQKALDERGIN